MNPFKRFSRMVYRPLPKIRRISDLTPKLTGEAQFLEGRHSRTYEFLRVVRIALEFIRGFRAFHFTPPAITVFGSARFPLDHRYCRMAEELSARLARRGFAIVTGGGPGIMEAANRGAFQAGGTSIGASIVLPHEQASNSYLTRDVPFYYFFVRKVMLVKYSYSYLIFPGGYGTLDEFSEALTLIQTGKLYDFPVFLVGVDYWSGFVDWMRASLLKEGAISENDLDFFILTDDLNLIEERILACAQRLRLPLQEPQKTNAQPITPASATR